MRLTDNDISSISVILNTWLGFHNTRRKVKGLAIAHCYILLACVWIEYLDKPITEGSLRRWLKMYHSYYLTRLVSFLTEENYLVLARQGKRNKYYTLTDKGRTTAVELLRGIDERLVFFFNKHQPRL